MSDVEELTRLIVTYVDNAAARLAAHALLDSVSRQVKHAEHHDTVRHYREALVSIANGGQLDRDLLVRIAATALASITDPEGGEA